MFAIAKIVLENIEHTRPIAILLSERAPTLEEAWQDALKDGNLSSGEFHKLSKLQETLGVSDEEVIRISGRSAAQTILKRGRARKDEIEFILTSSAGREEFGDFEEILGKGRISKHARKQLESLVEDLDRESEEE